MEQQNMNNTTQTITTKNTAKYNNGSQASQNVEHRIAEDRTFEQRRVGNRTEGHRRREQRTLQNQYIVHQNT